MNLDTHLKEFFGGLNLLVQSLENRNYTIFICLILFQTACNNLAPGECWTDYESNSIVVQESEQGPYGGHLIIHWKNQTTSAFTPSSILEYATLKGWTLMDSAVIHESKSEFPVYLEGIRGAKKDKTLITEFEQFIDSELTVYQFKTSWMLLNPGTDESTFENGYILLGKDQKSMTLYHVWGE
ncbi:MAG: hypothetical protein EP332_03510 [Bacteroidetes bacterium]|nr:MAG: hypothetical protein EP332_03510 [Bacteroidota bacterium]